MADFGEALDDLTGIWPVTVARIQRLETDTRRFMEELAAQTEARMRIEAPWAPVGPGVPWYTPTGAARTALTAKLTRYTSRNGRRWRLELFYDDDVLREMNPEEYARVGNYGAFLEDSNAGKYAILQPTALRLRQDLGRQLGRVWSGNSAIPAGTPGRFRDAPPSTRAGGR